MKPNYLQSARKRLALTSFADFVEIYLGHYLTEPSGKFQEYLYQVGQELLDGDNVRENVIASKETAKSTIITLGVTLAVGAAYGPLDQLDRFFQVLLRFV